MPALKTIKTKEELIDKLTKLFSEIKSHSEYESKKMVPGQMGLYDELHELDKELEDRFRNDWLNYHGYTVANSTETI